MRIQARLLALSLLLFVVIASDKLKKKKEHFTYEEINNVGAHLLEMRRFEGMIENDLRNVLKTLKGHSHTLSHTQTTLRELSLVSCLGSKQRGSLNTSISSLALDLHSTDQSLWSLTSGLNALQADLHLLLRSLNDSEKELTEAREVAGQSEMIAGLMDGKVTVDYETGEIHSGLTNFTSQFGNHAQVSQSSPSNPPSGFKHMLSKLQRAAYFADPAVLHLDIVLLRDMVLLCLATAIAGLSAAMLDLPHTLGYILGGMLVGPSCLGLIERVVQAETLAQFGSIFMLFGHGLVYSQHYSPVHTPAQTVHHSGGGFLFVMSLFLISFLACLSLGIVSSWVEGALLSLSVAFSSTSVVMDTLSSTKLRDTIYGSSVIELMAVQDLFMAPLLAIPSALSSIARSEAHAHTLAALLGAYCLMIFSLILVARQVAPRLMQVLSNPDRGLSPHLFTLAVVTYCLSMALMCEFLSLSHEAGALLAGLILMDSCSVSILRKAMNAVEPLTAVFGGMYLASLGMIMSPSFLLSHLPIIMAFVAAVYCLKVCVVTAVMRSLGFILPASLAAGAIMAQVSEVSLFFIARAQQLGLVSRQVYLIMVATTVTLLAVAPLASNAIGRVDRRDFIRLVS